MLCEKYGWTIEYVMKMSFPQINTLLKGDTELMNRDDQPSGHKETSAQDLAAGFLGMPGVKMSDSAREKLKKKLTGI